MMTRLTLLLALAITTAAATASGGEEPGTLMRFRLDEGQVLVYGAVADVKVEGGGGADVDFEIESTATITYLGDRATYDTYKAGTAQRD